MTTDYDAIRDKARSFFSSVTHDWDHIERVHATCMHIGDREGADMHILKTAAWLHDIGRKWQDDSSGEICHAERGAELASELLAEEFKMDQDEIDQIAHCIRTHRASDDDHMPTSLEARVLYDADKLDSLGAIGIGRAFLFAGEIGARMHDKDVDVASTTTYSRDDTAYRYFLDTQKEILDKLTTAEGRRFGRERMEYMEAFYNRMNREVQGEI